MSVTCYFPGQAATPATPSHVYAGRDGNRAVARQQEDAAVAKKMTKAELKAARAEFKKADRELQSYSEREYKQWRAAGGKRNQMPETAEYHRLNEKVNDTMAKLPWWAR